LCCGYYSYTIGAMDPILLSDRQWAAIAPRLPRRRPTGRPRADDRCCLDAVLWVLVSGARWRDLPPGRVAPMTAWRRLRNWQEAGAWPRIWQAYLGSLDAAGRKRWSRALLKGAFVPAHQAQRRWAPPPAPPSPPGGGAD
jgi:transposase